jgi:hypothetical protein
MLPIDVPYERYVIASLLRGRSRADIITCLKDLKIADDLNPNVVKKIYSRKNFKKHQQIVSKLSNQKDFKQGVCNILREYDVLEFFENMQSGNDTWKQCWDVLTINKLRDFVIILLSAGKEPKHIVNSFKERFHRKISEEAIAFFEKFFWDVREFSVHELISHAEALPDEKLKKLIMKTLDGKYDEALFTVGGKQTVNYQKVLKHMLFDAYVAYKSSLTETPGRNNAAKAWVDVILKLVDRISKLEKSGGAEDELRKLVESINLVKDDPTSILSLSEFSKKNKVV